MEPLPPRPTVRGAAALSREIVPAFVEYCYYGLIVYSLGLAGELFSMAFLGAGLNLALAIFCVIRLRARAISPILMPVSCGASFVLLQLMIHGEPLTGEYVRPFVIWIIEFVIVRSLCLRTGFVHRFPIVAMIAGMFLLQHLTVVGGSEVERVGLEGLVGLTNPNDLAQWFGFVAVCFVISGIETNRSIVRIANWLGALGCFVVVGLTVSRSTLVAVLIASMIALRHLLKRGFIPVLLLLLMIWVFFTTGVVGQISESYAERGTEESGRLLVWPLVVERILESPILGVATSDTGTYVVGSGDLTPHNGFLFVALAGGIVPSILFLAGWIQAARRAFRATIERLPDAPFLLPLLIYVFLAVLAENQAFTSHWAIFSLSLSLTSTAMRPKMRYAVRQLIQSTQHNMFLSGSKPNVRRNYGLAARPSSRKR